MGRRLYLLESMKLKKSDIFEFGVWEGKPIEWQVLATRGGILCISKYCLTQRRFDSKSSDWEKSELKQWLNTDFYNRAFTSEEKSFLMPYEGDKVTILSVNEAKKYLPSDSKRKATDLSGAYQKWWLRSSCFFSDFTGNVYCGGDIDYALVKFTSNSVRPVILLDNSVEEFLEPEED